MTLYIQILYALLPDTSCSERFSINEVTLDQLTQRDLILSGKFTEERQFAGDFHSTVSVLYLRSKGEKTEGKDHTFDLVYLGL